VSRLWDDPSAGSGQAFSWAYSAANEDAVDDDWPIDLPDDDAAA
jgi:hypothetical protein